MAVPHYTYLVLNMPTEQGVLSLHANLDVAYSCKKESFALAEATDISIRMQDCLATSQQISPEDLEIPTMEATPSINQVQGGEGSRPRPRRPV